MNAEVQQIDLHAIDLFAGCGGLSLGLRRAGLNVRAALEIDPAAAEAYAMNHQDTRLIVADVRTVTASDLLRAACMARGELDLLAGCPPCQGFSRLRRRNGGIAYDRRNDLVRDFARLVEGLLPKTVMFENVPGLEQDHRFHRFTERLRALGYFADWGILDAADFGVPQRRKRLILVGSRMGSIELPRGCSTRRTVRVAIGGLVHPRRSNDILHTMFMRSGDRVRRLIREIPPNGGSRSDLGARKQLPCHIRTEGFGDIYGRMRWDDVAPTLTSGCFNPSKGRFLHPRQHRPITLREAALLQTFPRSYRFDPDLGLTTVARLIGDALPPLFAEKQARHIAKHLRGQRWTG